MPVFLKIVFWISTVAMVYSYLFYPLILKLLAKSKQSDKPSYYIHEEAPMIYVLMAAFNEEKVIQEKIESLQALDYPEDKIEIHIGSDNSTDTTNALIQAAAEKDKRIFLHAFKSRQGKPNIINQLAANIASKHSIHDSDGFLMTDASVMLDKQLLKNLVRHFQDKELGLIDSFLYAQGASTEGVAQSESTYLSREAYMKYREGLVWNKMVGPFGACYLMRAYLYQPVPNNFLVDDFYIAMKIIEQGRGLIMEPAAKCYEGANGEIKEEFKRKARIGAGNFQNLVAFKHLLNPFKYKFAFIFWSHKVLRWIGPFFIIFAFVASGVLAFQGSALYLMLFLAQFVLWLIIPVFDTALQQMNIHINLFRNIRYFLHMNVALFFGFIKYINGIKTNIWQPPERS